MIETARRVKSKLQALQAVHAALSPLDPEQRRQVVEAVHALLEIAAGKSGGDHPHHGPPQAKRSRPRR